MTNTDINRLTEQLNLRAEQVLDTSSLWHLPNAYLMSEANGLTVQDFAPKNEATADLNLFALIIKLCQIIEERFEDEHLLNKPKFVNYISTLFFLLNNHPSNDPFGMVVRDMEKAAKQQNILGRGAQATQINMKVVSFVVNLFSTLRDLTVADYRIRVEEDEDTKINPGVFENTQENFKQNLGVGVGEFAASVLLKTFSLQSMVFDLAWAEPNKDSVIGRNSLKTGEDGSYEDYSLNKAFKEDTHLWIGAVLKFVVIDYNSITDLDLKKYNLDDGWIYPMVDGKLFLVQSPSPIVRCLDVEFLYEHQDILQKNEVHSTTYAYSLI